MADRRKNWLLCGTNQGYFSLWDLRFQICVKSWGHPHRARINKLAPYFSTLSPSFHTFNDRLGYNGLSSGGGGFTSGSSHVTGRMVLCGVESKFGEVSAWDIEAGEPKEIFCSFISSSGRMDAEEELKRIFSKDNFKPLTPPGHSYDFDMDTTLQINSRVMDRHHKGNGGNGIPNNLPMGAVRSFVSLPETSFLLTGGTDKKLRYWDRSNIESSFVLSGLARDEPPLRYHDQAVDSLLCHYERPVALTYGGSSSHFFLGQNNSSISGGGASGDGSGTGSSSSSSSTSTSIRTPIGGRNQPTQPQKQLLQQSSQQRKASQSIGSPSISRRVSTSSTRNFPYDQQDLTSTPDLTSHVDAVTDLILSQIPYPLIISGSRDGIINVWK